MRIYITAALAAISIWSLIATPATAHTRKGTVMMKGTAAYSSWDRDGQSNLSVFQLSPTVHYFVANQVGFGGTLNYVRSSDDNVSNSDMLIGPSLGYYFSEDGTTIPYLGAGLFLESVSSERQTGIGRVSNDDNGTVISLYGGLAIFLKEHLALTPEISFNFGTLDESSTGVIFGVGLAGFIYRPVYASHR